MTNDPLVDVAHLAIRADATVGVTLDDVAASRAHTGARP